MAEHEGIDEDDLREEFLDQVREATDSAPEILATFNPSPDPLLNLLRDRVDEEMLQEIALADYGCDYKKHLQSLRIIRDHGRYPDEESWNPGEVLSLTRWLNPDKESLDQDTPASLFSLRGHVIVVFCCTTILKVNDSVPRHGLEYEEEATLSKFVESISVLDYEMQKSAISFLSWRIPRIAISGERPLFQFALLYLLTLLGRDKYPEDALSEIAQWMKRDESANCKIDPSYRLCENFQRTYDRSLWVGFAEELLKKSKQIDSQKIRDQIEQIALEIITCP